MKRAGDWLESVTEKETGNAQPGAWRRRFAAVFPRPGQCVTHVHSHITRAVTAMDSCFALLGAHQHGIAVGSMNKENPRVSLKDPSDFSRFDCHHNWRWFPSGSVGIFESVVSGPFKLVSLREEEIRCLTWTSVVFNTENAVQSLILMLQVCTYTILVILLKI